jgi:hypothetical protein
MLGRQHVGQAYLTLETRSREPSGIATVLSMRPLPETPVGERPCGWESLVFARLEHELLRAAKKRVLDFSAGWGDRLAGFCASAHGEEYYGCDPHSALHALYAKQVALYQSSKRVVTEALPAEDWVLPADYFDLCFTSPPYHNAERYSDDPGQSWKRYASLKGWLHGFLFKALRNAYRALAPNGFLVINISDIWTRNVSAICDPMGDFLTTELKASYCDCWGLQLNKRPSGRADRAGVFCEPIWIFRKGPAVEVSGFGDQLYLRSARGW